MSLCMCVNSWGKAEARYGRVRRNSEEKPDFFTIGRY